MVNNKLYFLLIIITIILFFMNLNNDVALRRGTLRSLPLVHFMHLYEIHVNNNNNKKDQALSTLCTFLFISKKKIDTCLWWRLGRQTDHRCAPTTRR